FFWKRLDTGRFDRIYGQFVPKKFGTAGGSEQPEQRPDRQGQPCQALVARAGLASWVRRRRQVEREQEGAPRLKAHPSILLEAVPDHVLELRGHPVRPRERRRIVLEDRGECLEGGSFVTRRRAGDHLVEDGAEAEEVGACVECMSTNLLRRHVTDAAECRLGPCQARRILQTLDLFMPLGEPEVQNLQPLLERDEDVL